jgi:hypothetical protein
MQRALSKLERMVMMDMCPAVATANFLDSCRATPQNSDASIVDFWPSDSSLLGENIIELAHGVFKNNVGDICGFALLLGDENGIPRQLDLHGIADGLSVNDLATLEFNALV